MNETWKLFLRFIKSDRRRRAEHIFVGRKNKKKLQDTFYLIPDMVDTSLAPETDVASEDFLSRYGEDVGIVYDCKAEFKVNIREAIETYNWFDDAIFVGDQVVIFFDHEERLSKVGVL